MSPLLAHATLVRPLLSDFVGSITADGQTTRVAALALTTQGKAVLLNLVANDTTLSAITARFFKGEQLLFSVAEGMAWGAPNLFGRADAVSYRQIKAAIPNTREKNYLVIPHTADIGEGPPATSSPITTRPPRTHARFSATCAHCAWCSCRTGPTGSGWRDWPPISSRRCHRLVSRPGRSRATRRAGSSLSARPCARSAWSATHSLSPRKER